MRLDGIEIKVTIDGDQVTAARDRWLSDGDGERRTIYFFEEQVDRDRTALPLFEDGVILRAREVEEDEDDSTVKFRPCDRSRLTAEWLKAGIQDDRDFKLEEDWAGNDQRLAASLGAGQREGEIAAVFADRRPVRALFSSDQERLVVDYGRAVDWDALRIFGPVEAERWKNVRIGPFSVFAELWEVGEALRFLELSIRTDPPEELALAEQRDFQRRIGAEGFDPDAVQEPKTKKVLEYFATVVR